MRRRCQENDLGQISKDRAKYVRHDAMPTGLCKSEFIKIETLQGIHLIGVADMVNEYINENVKKVIKSLTKFLKIP